MYEVEAENAHLIPSGLMTRSAGRCVKVIQSAKARHITAARIAKQKKKEAANV